MLQIKCTTLVDSDGFGSEFLIASDGKEGVEEGGLFRPEPSSVVGCFTASLDLRTGTRSAVLHRLRSNGAHYSNTYPVPASTKSMKISTYRAAESIKYILITPFTPFHSLLNPESKIFPSFYTKILHHIHSELLVVTRPSHMRQRNGLLLADLPTQNGGLP
jgi:hypothetical protein